MHPESYAKMSELVAKYLDRDSHLSVIDIGSYDVNDTYKNIFSFPDSKWTYLGADISAGPNVDVVIPEQNWTNLSENGYDVVISGQVLEHTKAPWLFILDIKRICKPQGLVIIIAPWQWAIHRYPLDCWRILPDGMEYLLGTHAGMQVLEVGTNVDDCFGVARKI